MHYYRRNLGDYAKKCGRLSMLQHGAYTLLLDSCYDREQFPTLDEAIEWTWASTDAEIEAVKFVLSRFFRLEDGVYVQDRVLEELNSYKEKASTNRRIAVERETKRKEKSTERVRNVYGTCSDGERLDNGSSPNQEPITNNQEPITNNQEPKERVKRIRASHAAVQRMDSVSVQVSESESEAHDVFPAGLNVSAWHRWVSYRKEIGKSLKPASIHSAQLAMAKHGSQQAAVVEQSIANGWQGLFALKEAGGTVNKQASVEQRNKAVVDAWLAKQGAIYESN